MADTTGSRFFKPYKKQKIRQKQPDEKDDDDDDDDGKLPIGNATDPVTILDDDSSSCSSDSQESERQKQQQQQQQQQQKTQFLPAPSSKSASANTGAIAKEDDAKIHDDGAPSTVNNKRKPNLPTEKEISNAPAGSSTDRSNTNPFACFAYTPQGSNGKDTKISNNNNPLLKWRMSTANQKEKKGSSKNKGKVCVTANSNANNKKQKKEIFVSISDLSEKEQTRITTKWHSMVDKMAPLEVKRFQLLVAARLHARCQEITVRKAMKSLQDHFSTKTNDNDDIITGFTVQTISKSDPEVLASYITNLQFYNSKAEQIVKAANEILIKFNGIVPEDEKSLLQITGVGKVFADLLAFVNTRKAHEGKGS